MTIRRTTPRFNSIEVELVAGLQQLLDEAGANAVVSTSRDDPSTPPPARQVVVWSDGGTHGSASRRVQVQLWTYYRENDTGADDFISTVEVAASGVQQLQNSIAYGTIILSGTREPSSATGFDITIIEAEYVQKATRL